MALSGVLPGHLLVQLVVRPYAGESGRGPAYGPARTVRGVWDDTEQLVRTGTSAKVTAAGTVLLDLDVDCPLESLVTVPDGRTLKAAKVSGSTPAACRWTTKKSRSPDLEESAMAVTDVTAPTKSPTRVAPLDVATAGTASGLAVGAGNGIRFLDNGRRSLRVRNAGGSPCVVSILVPEVGPDGQLMAALTFSVAATTGDRIFPPLPARYRDSLGRVTVEFSFVTSVTYDIIEWPQV